MKNPAEIFCGVGALAVYYQQQPETHYENICEDSPVGLERFPI
jgi:hypothetical protein